MKRKRQFHKALRLGFILIMSMATATIFIFFSVGPAFVAKHFNPINSKPLLPINPSSQALHQSLSIVDLHADSLLWGRDLSKLSNYGHVDVPRLIQGNVALQFFTSVTKVPSPLMLEGNSEDSDNVLKLAILQRWPILSWFSLAQRALYQARQLQALERKASETFRIIKTKQDLNNYLAQKENYQQMTAGLLGLEGAQAFEGKINNVNRFYEAGFRVIGLVHFFDNEVGASAHGLSKSGLTPFGEQVIRRMEELNMIVDLAHASSRTIDEVLQITNRPVLVSHTGVQGTCLGVRNLSDRQLEQIAQSGGIIGIGFWKTAVCGDDVHAIVRAIRYVVDKVGVEHVALGSDFDGAVRVPFDVANMNQITQALQEKGFTETEIRKIMGLNVISLLKQNLPS